MKRAFLLGLAALAIMLMAPTGAKAQASLTDMSQKAWYLMDAPESGWYLGGAGMLAQQTDSEAKVSTPSTHTLSFNKGWGVSAFGGYAFENGFRTELEFNYRRADVGSVSNEASTDIEGSIRNLSIMGNVFYDYRNPTRFTPYVGLGIGPSLVDANDLKTIGSRVLDGQKIAFAYQGIAGLATALDRDWTLITDYRYFATTDVKFDTDTTASADVENASHNFVVGLRYTFAAPAAVVEPLPMPEPEPMPVVRPIVQPAPVVLPPVAQSYMVFFNFDKSKLTPEANRIIAAAAQDYQSGKYIRIVVTGHTDTMGGSKYNQKLSERRAMAVQKAFAEFGIPSEQVSAFGQGKTNLLIPTADSVREAQNRRAEILLDQ